MMLHVLPPRKGCLYLLLALLMVWNPSFGTAQPNKPTPHYEMTLRIDPAAHLLVVEGSLAVPAGLSSTPSIDLEISHAAGDIRWRSLTPGVRISATRRAVAANSQTSDLSAAGARSIWTVSGDWRPGAAVRIGFSYETRTAEPDGFFYVGPEIAFGAGGWYPAIDDVKATASLEISAPAGYAIAAAGSAQGEARRTAEIVSRRFISSVPGELLFAVSPPGANIVQLSPKLTLATLRPRPTDAGWRDGLRGVQEALEYEFGPLPYPHVTVIEVPDAIADKAGFGAFAAPGAVLARSQFIDQPFNVAVLAHEFSHLWWAHYVGLEGTKGDFLLDEGLAQYGSMVAVDRVLGVQAGAAYRRRGMPGFNENLFSALGYLKINAARFDRPLLALEDDGLSYWIAYSKAGHAWYALAEEMGRANFRTALREILATHGAGYVTWDRFVEDLQRHGTRPLTPFIDAWFAAADAPRYEVSWRRTGRTVRGRIAQGAAIKPATLELEVVFADGTRSRHRVRATGRQTPFELPAPQPVRSVTLDPDYKILRWSAELRDEAAVLADTMRALVLTALGRKDEAEQLLTTFLRARPTDNRHDRLLLARSTLARLAEDRGCAPCALGHVEAALAIRPVALPPLAPVYLGMALRARRLGSTDLAARAAELAVAADALVGNANGAAARLGAVTTR